MARNYPRRENLGLGENDAENAEQESEDTATSENPEAQPEEPTHVTVTVAARRSLMVPVKVGTRTIGGQQMDVTTSRVAKPGEKVEVHRDEVAQLVARGFVEPGHVAPFSDVEPPNVAPGTVTVNGRDGTVTEISRE